MERRTCSVILFTLLTVFNAAIGRPEVRGRIVAGSSAIQGQFPFYVLIKKHSYEDVEAGGSLISKDWVLTATHVVEKAHSVILVFGITKLSDKNALTLISENIYAHPGHKRRTMTYDIALIKLPRPVSFNENIQPIALPTFSMIHSTFEDERVTVIGFGFTGDMYQRELPKDLQYTHLTIIDWLECSNELEKNISEVIICGKADFKGSTCNGDSGGPAVIEDENGNFIQIGIISFGYNHRCELPFPVGLTRITSFLNWIHTATGLVKA